MTTSTGSRTGSISVIGRRDEAPVLMGLRRFVRREPVGFASLLLLTAMVAGAAIGPYLLPYDALRIDLSQKFISPGFETSHLLGTDQLGRDLLSRLVVAGRVSLATALGALALGVIVASILGMCGGFFTHWASQALQRAMDGMMALPPLILALAIATGLGNDAKNIAIAIAIVMLPPVFRVVRGATLAVRNLDYVIAGTALGGSNLHIITRHIVPNIFGTIVTIASIWVGAVILIEASLGFLGIGVQPPNPTWGNMLSGEGRTYMTSAPWIALMPGIAITITVFAANMLGDSLRAFFDPKSRRER